MKNGLYEKVYNRKIKEYIEDKKIKKIRKIDNKEVAKVLSIDLEKKIRKKLEDLDNNEEQANFINSLSRLVEGEYDNSEEFKELLLLHDEESKFKELDRHRPKTSIASSTLFTGTHGPSLESELSREIRTCDRADFLVSFIKYSGLRLIYDDLVEFTKNNKLRIITTSYMGASDYKAIMALSKLPNTELKISYDTKRTRLHAKAYYFERDTGFSTAYIGSSNISNPALSDGLEWNLKISEYTSKDVINSFKRTFNTYWNDDEFILFNPENIENKIQLKESLEKQDYKTKDDYIFFDLKPYSHQLEILEDLKVEREVYLSNRNLVVAATGTGKTMVSAFDYKNNCKKGYKNILFLAHREEILKQSLYTFRNVLKDQNFGELWVGKHRPVENNHVFASIQTLNSNKNYEKYDKNHFDYIVIDESHHIKASSYLGILEYFTPEILLGLTATPERMDGKNILEYFNNRIASEIRLTDAIDRKLLSPFHYFGVTDPEDLSHLTWTRGGYDISELEHVYTKSKQRVQVVIDSLNKYLTDINNFKALGFCVSIKHANFMAKSFNKAQIKSIALHSESSDEERKLARRQLQNGEINCIFTVDLFNEGVDIPEVDTVLFLRPTESLTIFLQQLGRGLRLSEGKEALTVLDFVGQANRNYDFSFKFRALMGKGDRNIKDEIIDEFPNMPAGCHIKLEKIAQEYILKNIQSSTFNISNLRNMVVNFSENFTNELNLENFLNNYGIDKDKFYSKYSFYNILYQSGLKKEYLVTDKKRLQSSLRRFSQIDSNRLLDFSKKILTRDFKEKDLNKEEKLLLAMFHYTIWTDIPDKSYVDSVNRLKEYNKDLVREMLDIIDYNKKNIKNIEIPYNDKDIPLDIYASYSIEQVMAAFGKTTENKKYPMRQGVLYIKEKNTDLFFITINKNEEDYLPTTMYNDYAINKELFHWESQSTTSISSPTGKRYIKNDKNHRVLFFVRDKKHKFNATQNYTFLGNGRYVSHKGSNPIQIIWKLDNKIPERIIRKSSLRITN